MVGVAVVVGHVYGRVAAVGIVLLTVSNYQIVGRQIKVICWMSLRKFLIVLVMLGNNYYFSVINSQLMSNIAIALVLIDNFQVSSINLDLSSQNEEMKENEKKLEAAKTKLGAIKQSLLAFRQSVAEAEAAKAETTEKAEELSSTIQPNLVSDLENVNTLVEALMQSADLRDLIAHENALRVSIDSMLTTYSGICEQLRPLVPKLDQVGTAIDATTARLEATVQLSSQQIVDLTRVVETFEAYKRSVV
jgi:predicted  nucleic acid-binding Zn-ribbon protein